jgi:hypothetical protein
MAVRLSFLSVYTYRAAQLQCVSQYKDFHVFSEARRNNKRLKKIYVKIK